MHSNNPDEQARLDKVSDVYQEYLRAIAKLPYPGVFEGIHETFVQLAEANFHIPSKAWLNPFELAHIVNYAALYGSSNNYAPRFELNSSLNSLKKLWALAEDENKYSNNDDYIASFLLRWVYQQLPFCIHPERTLKTCRIMRELLSYPDVSAYAESVTGLKGDRLMDLSILLLRAFQRHVSYSESDLRILNKPHKDLPLLLRLLSADRQERLQFQREKLEVKTVVEKPYEISTLLRYPIVRIDTDYYAPYPELVGYGAARGLFFRFSEEGKHVFLDPFSEAMEKCAARLLRDTIPDAEIITEDDEREMGWQGKTNDISLILGDTALLFECKASAFFVEAKRTASPEIILKDVRKNLVNNEKGKGLIQLHKKIEAIRNKSLPSALIEKYKNVQQIFSIVLLYDAIEHANAAPIVGNIIKDELALNGIPNFTYQIWHLEELFWLAESAGADLVEWTAKKFRSECRPLGLNSFISNRPGMHFLNQIMYMPSGNSKAFKILTYLSAKQEKCEAP